MSAIENILGMLPDRVGDGKNSQIYTPPHTAQEMVNTLPAEVFNKDTTFLDICCKSGIFLYKIYQKLMESPSMVEEFPDETDRATHIIHKQLFGISPSIFCQMFSTRTVYGYLDQDSHIVSINEYELVMKNADKSFLYNTLKEKFGTMKFDVVIGNPPYNNDIYLDFVTLGHTLSNKYTMMITPAKWQAKGGAKNEAFRKNIVPYMEKIVYFPVSTDLFDIKEWDGITYYGISKTINNNKTIENKCEWQKLFNCKDYRRLGNHLNNAFVSILDKVTGDKNFKVLKVNYDTSFYINASECKELSVVKIGDYSLPIIGGDSQGNMIEVGYYPREWIRKNDETIDNYKIIMHSMPGRNNTLVSDGTSYGNSAIKILKPEECCKNAYMVLFTTPNINEAKSFESYMNTRFIRTLTYCGCVGSQAGCDEYWRFVPAPEAFDHIFTDAELYKKYDLTEEEINIIESVIKERK